MQSLIECALDNLGVVEPAKSLAMAAWAECTRLVPDGVGSVKISHELLLETANNHEALLEGGLRDLSSVIVCWPCSALSSAWYRQDFCC